ncbi:MAG: baseplate J/gp47 family protein [Candidatus Methylomirabilis sp.]|nr:baseplate J/gp47 family protein [Candidatus Methylomirabilis sp.]
MNPDTINRFERPYQEIVDDILTAIVGGVVNEPIFFDLKETFYPLSQRAADVRSITGTWDKRHYTFQKEVDFIFSEGDNAVVWQPGATQPDDETIFYVDYFRPESQSRSPLSDINVGSVTRTLSEAIGREIATVYQQVNRAYLSGFIDTAEGQALDLVVSILGVKRKTKEFATGLVTFFRDPAAGDGNVSLPEGIALSTAKGDATFVTTDLRTLQRGQARIDVPVRAGDGSKGEAGKVKAGEITKLSQPITGIARVTNFEATVLGAEGETDEQLRLRAKARLRGLGKATLAALANAIFEGRAKLAEVWDPNSPRPSNRSPAS